MLRVYQVSLDVVRGVRPVVEAIAKQDRELGRQIRQAVASVPLNIAEGSGVRGGNRRLRYETALGSARELRAQIEVAAALGYCRGLDDQTDDRLDRVIATLVKLVR